MNEPTVIAPRRFAGPPRVALAPGGTRDWLVDAIVAGGGTVVEPRDAEALVWTDPGRSAELASALRDAPDIGWVQLPWAGIEPLVGVLDPARIWTCGKGVYAREVAEHALAMTLAGLRGLVHYGRQRSWSGPRGTNLIGAHVVILGGGGICRELVAMLAPFDARITVVRRSTDPMPGVDDVTTLEHLDDALPHADVVVLALALTPDTAGVLDARRLALLAPHGWVVNVARGAHIVTDALVEALGAGRLGGAALDVFETEPLPDDHPLWSLPNCLITPHVANTPDMAKPVLSRRVADNVRRFGAGEPLIGVVDLDAGY